jgi:hypothetical protein
VEKKNGNMMRTSKPKAISKITPPQRGEKLDVSGCMLTYFIVNHAKFPILLITNV